MPSRLPLVLLALGFATACAGPDDAAGGAATGAEWRLEPLARIGSPDDAAQSLTRVGQVVLGPDGLLFVSQPEDSRILVFGSGGTLEATIGGGGQGPGEFRSIRSIGLLGDTLYASDQALGRMSFFALDGGYLGSVAWVTPPPAPPTEQVRYARTVPNVLLPDGTALLEPSAAFPVPPGFNEPGPIRWTIPRWYLRVDPAGEILNTVTRFETAETTFRVTGGPTGFSMRNPFDQAPLTGFLAGGSGVVVVEREPAPAGRPASFPVTAIRPAGDTLFSIAVPFDPVPLTERHVHEAIERVSRGRQSHVVVPSLAERERALRAEGVIPATHVPVSALATGQDGTIWLQGPLVPGEEQVAWTVLGSDGEVQGSVRLPARQTVMAANGEDLVVQEHDELDVPYLVRYRVRR